MPKTSAGLLMYKIKENKLYLLLAHSGGPYNKGKDLGYWSIPKGEIDNGNFSEENMLNNAIRETKEEIGISPPAEKSKYFYLDQVTLKSGKVVHAWAFEGDWHGLLICSSYATIEYPYKSGKYIKVPEIDKADFFPVDIARKKINAAQMPFIDRIEKHLKEKNRI